MLGRHVLRTKVAIKPECEFWTESGQLDAIKLRKIFKDRFASIASASKLNECVG